MASLNFQKLKGEHVLVIGGTSGIGRAVAEGAAASGASVTISSSSQTRVDTAVREIKAAYPAQAITGRVCDLSKPTTLAADLDALFRAAAATGMPVNHVVLTAADSLAIQGLDSVTPDLVHAAAHMRLLLPVLVGQAAARHLPRNARSSIVLTTGSVADKPDPGWAVVAYFAGGIASLTRALALDLKPVRVNAVQPGYVDTALWGSGREAMARLVEEKMPTGKFAAVEDVAEAYLWLLKDGNATGTIAKTDSGCFLE